MIDASFKTPPPVVTRIRLSENAPPKNTYLEVFGNHIYIPTLLDKYPDSNPISQLMKSSPLIAPLKASTSLAQHQVSELTPLLTKIEGSSCHLGPLYGMEGIKPLVALNKRPSPFRVALLQHAASGIAHGV